MDGQGDGMHVAGRPGLGAVRAPAEGIAADGVLHGSERKAVLQAVGYNLLFHFDHSTFSKIGRG